MPTIIKRSLLTVTALLAMLLLAAGAYAVKNINPVESEMVEDVLFGTAINERGEEENLKLDVYLPANRHSDPTPTIIWFHGGGFAKGNDKRQIYIKWLADEFARRGYVGVSVDYRVRDNPNADLAGTVRDAVSDARMALRWVVANADDFGIDPQRIILAGGSAGGGLVANLIHDPDAPITRQSGVIGAINLWGPGAGDYRLFRAVSELSPPTLAIHGTEDPLIPASRSEEYVADLKHAGIDASLELLQGGGHPPLRHLEQIYRSIDDFLRKLTD